MSQQKELRKNKLGVARGPPVDSRDVARFVAPNTFTLVSEGAERLRAPDTTIV